ncbi:MAG: cation transporter [Microbacterium enclense]
MTQQRVEIGRSPVAGGGCGSSSCGCGGGAAASTPGSVAEATTTVSVDGMTCAHCVRAVTDELNAVEGVTVVNVDLHAGAASLVHFRSSRPVDEAEIAAAIDEAGYSLTR